MPDDTIGFDVLQTSLHIEKLLSGRVTIDSKKFDLGLSQISIVGGQEVVEISAETRKADSARMMNVK